MALFLFTALLSHVSSTMSFTRLSSPPQRARLSDTGHVEGEKMSLLQLNGVGPLADCSQAAVTVTLPSISSRYSLCHTSQPESARSRFKSQLSHRLTVINSPPPPTLSSRLTSSLWTGQRRRVAKLLNRGCAFEKKRPGSFSNARYYENALQWWVTRTLLVSVRGREEKHGDKLPYQAEVEAVHSCIIPPTGWAFNGSRPTMTKPL